MLHSLWILAATFFTVLTYVFVKWVPPQYEIWDIFFVRFLSTWLSLPF